MTRCAEDQAIVDRLRANLAAEQLERNRIARECADLHSEVEGLREACRVATDVRDTAEGRLIALYAIFINRPEIDLTAAEQDVVAYASALSDHTQDMAQRIARGIAVEASDEHRTERSGEATAPCGCPWPDAAKPGHTCATPIGPQR